MALSKQTNWTRQNTAQAVSHFSSALRSDWRDVSPSSSTAHKRGIVIGHISQCSMIGLLLLVDFDTRENIPSRSLNRLQ